MEQYTKEELVEKFQTNDTLKVVFIKKDKSERIMVCTRKPENMPEKDRPTGKSKRKEPEFTLPVYELENGWRSFDVRRVISVEVIL